MRAVLYLSGFLVLGEVGQACPAFTVGLVRVESNGATVFHATAEAEMVLDLPESLKLAEAEASLASRAILQAEKAVPKTPDGHLQGVLQATCIEGRKVFVTSTVNPVAMIAAERMQSEISKSIRAHPTPK